MQTKKKHPPPPATRNPVGRPPRETYDGDKPYQYQLRMSQWDNNVWEKYAQAAGLKLADWIRLTCAFACGGSGRIVRAEIVTTYQQPREPDPTGLVGRPIEAIRDAVQAGVDVRAAVDALLADNSPTGQLIVAELATRMGVVLLMPEQET